MIKRFIRWCRDMQEAKRKRECDEAANFRYMKEMEIELVRELGLLAMRLQQKNDDLEAKFGRVATPRGAPMTNHPPDEPTLTCSEVVERLRQECFLPEREYYAAFDTRKAESTLHSWRDARIQELLDSEKWLLEEDKRLHSWREHRVQELEEALEYEIAIRDGMVREIESLVPELLINGNALDFTKAAVKQFADWREQIRKGAKHE